MMSAAPSSSSLMTMTWIQTVSMTLAPKDDATTTMSNSNPPHVFQTVGCQSR